MGEETVRDAYDERPFPHRDPEDEASRLIRSDYGNMRIVNSVFWGGKKEMHGLRILDAGCGTGDVVIYLAEQLKGTSAEIVALDISERTLDIVRKRAQKRGLTNIRFVHASISDLGSLGLGKFHYIVCTSVLPHLDDPESGLKLLADSLEHDGGMLIQVYAKYGRFPINLVQGICRIVNEGQTDVRKKYENAQKIVKSLPKNHPFMEIQGYSEDPYDLTIEDRTCGFDVAGLYRFIDNGGLQIVRFKDFPLYSPETYGCALSEVKRLGKMEQESVAELLNGHMVRHILFASKKGAPAPLLSPENDALVPLYKHPDQELPDLKGDEAVLFRTKEYLRQVKIGSEQCFILRLVDGKRSIGAILDEAAAVQGRERADIMRDWLQIFNATLGSDFIVLNLPG